MSSVTLYGYSTSPFVRKTGCFLYFKGVDFVHVPVDPTDPARTIGFTNQTQVPVLEIDGEWRLESSEHAHWLDQRFPDAPPLCPAEHRARIETIDRWISDVFLASIFRSAIDGEFDLDFRFRGWRLAALLDAQTPLPASVRHSWPERLREAPFIQAMADRFDRTEPPVEMQKRIFGELVAHLGDGPFLGGLETPTMLDLAVFPQLVFGYLFGLADQLTAAAHPGVRAWLQRVATHLPPNPTLAADEMLIQSLERGLR